MRVERTMINGGRIPVETIDLSVAPVAHAVLLRLGDHRPDQRSDPKCKRLSFLCTHVEGYEVQVG